MTRREKNAKERAADKNVFTVTDKVFVSKRDNIPMSKEDRVPVSKEYNGTSLVITSCHIICNVAYTLVVAAMLALAQKIQYKIQLRDSYPDKGPSNKHIRQWIEEETSLDWFYKITHLEGLSGKQSRVGCY